jgi:hypothetical protein
MKASKLSMTDLTAYARSILPLPRMPAGSASPPLPSQATARVSCPFARPRSVGLPPQWLSGPFNARQLLTIPNSCNSDHPDAYLTGRISEVHGDYEVARRQYNTALLKEINTP